MSEAKFTTDTLLAALRDHGTASAAMVSLAGGPSFYDAQKDRNDARDLIAKHFAAYQDLLEALQEAASTLAMLTDPDRIKQSRVQEAWASAVASEAKARAAIAKAAQS